MKYLTNTVVRFGILRFDDVMIILYFLSTMRGSDCPATLLHADATLSGAGMLFKKLRREFENLWNDDSRASALPLAELTKLLGEVEEAVNSGLPRASRSAR